MLPPRWRRHPAWLAVVLVLLVVAVADRSGWLGRRRSAPSPSQYHDQIARVVHVVDGDTLDIDIPDGDRPDTRVRLWGVDTPETVHPKVGTMYYGPEASAFAKETLLGKRVRLELVPGQVRDRYERVLAYVYLVDSGVMFNELLLETGHAYADPRFDHVWKERFREIEARARRAKVGLWRDVRPEQYPAWKQHVQ